MLGEDQHQQDGEVQPNAPVQQFGESFEIGTEE